MKKLLLIGLASLLLLATIQSCQRSSAEGIRRSTTDKIIPSPDYLESLKAAGFTNLPTFVKRNADIKREQYKALYGANYIADEELSTLLEDNGFLLGPSICYVGEIPADPGVKIVDNLRKISAREDHLDRFDNQKGEFLNQKDALDLWNAHNQQYDIEVVPLVFIAAPKDKFDLSKGNDLHINKDNTITPKKPDPIALYKVKGGWLELARW